MNEINFEMQDVGKIDLSMDVGVKKIFPPIENLEVTPTKEQQAFTHENSYGYDNVTVNPIPDEYIIPDGTLEVTVNGDVDVTNFKKARVGVYTPPKLQDKEITPSKQIQIVNSDNEYDGLNQVIVNSIPEEYIIPNLQDKSITITENGIQNITFDEGYDGLNSVEVTTKIESSGGGSVGHPYIAYEYGGDNTNTTTHTLSLSSLANSIKGIWDRIIVYGFVRGDYTISDHITILCEKEVTNGTTNQKLFVGYTDTAIDVVLKQSVANRLSLRAIFLSNCGTPIVIDDIENVKTGDVAITTDDYLNIYLETIIMNAVVTGVNFNEWGGAERTWWYASVYASDDKVIKHTGGDAYGAIAHIKIPTRK